MHRENEINFSVNMRNLAYRDNGIIREHWVGFALLCSDSK